MAVSISGITQADAVNSSSGLTQAAVGPGDAAAWGISNPPGMNGGNSRMLIQEVTATDGYLYTAWKNFDASATYDMSGDKQFFIMHFRNEIANYHQFPTTGADADEAIALILFSGGGSTNWAVWYVPFSSTLVNAEWHPICTARAPDATGGTWDDTDVTGYGIGSRSTATSYAMVSIFNQLLYIDDPQLSDTNSDALTLQDYIDNLTDTANSYVTNAIREAGTTKEFPFPITITARNYNDTDPAIGIAFRDDVVGYASVDAGVFSITYRPPASGTQVLDNPTFATLGTEYDLTFDGTNSGATLTVNNILAATIRNLILDGAGLNVTAGTFTDAATVDISDADLTCSITSTGAPIDWTADIVAGSTITTDSDIDITFLGTDLSDINLNLTAELTISVDPTGASQTYDLSGISTSSALKLWNKDTANATTVTVPSGITTKKIDLWFNYDTEASGPFSEGETLTFGNGATATLHTLVDNGTTGEMYCELLTGSAPPDNNSITGGTSSATANVNEASGANKSTLTISQTPVTFTINTNVSALIQIYTTNTQTVLDSTTGTALAFTHSGQTIDYTIQAAGYIPQRFTGETLSGTTAVTINLVDDPVYNASHGLTFTTDYSYNASTRVMTIVANQEGRDLYSALIDDFQTETALRNCPFPLKAIGPDRIDFLAVGYYNTATTVGATIDSGDIQFWKGAGMQWEHDTTGNPTKKFYSIKSSNTLVASSVVGYTQVLAGTPVEATLVSNQVNQVIQFFEDTNGDGTPDYNYTDHLLFKGFLTGYYQARWDVINDGGVSTLEPYEYNISLTQEAIAGTTGDQAITITTLTDHTGAPLVVGSKNFDYEFVDPGTNTAENLLAQHNYNVYNAVNTLISGSLYTSYKAFDLPDLLVEAGANYETERGYFEGDGAVTDLSGVYCSRSGSDHPDITRFQSNDGTYYTPAVTANATGTNLPDDVGGVTRLQIFNLTASTASAHQTSTAYTEGDVVLRTSGVGTENTAGLFFRCISAGTSGGTEPTWVITTPGVFGTSGSQTTDNTVTWECFAVLLYDADPASTGWSDTYFDGEEFSDGETARIRFAHLNGATSFEYGQTTAAVTAAGFSFDGSLFVSADSVYATNAVDGSSAAVTNKFSPDYGNNEIDLDTNSDFAVTEAFAYYCYELTTSSGMHQAWGAVTGIDTGNYRNNTSVFSLYFDETAGFVKQTDSARWFRDDDTRPARDPTTGGNGIEINWRNPVYAYDGGGGGYSSADRARDDAIKAKTDSLTFTVTGQVDSNVKYVHDIEVDGSGTTGDPWGPV